MNTSENNSKTFNINIPAYLAFTGTGAIFLFMQDVSQSVIFFGIALVFDPFDQGIVYTKRTLFQRTLPLVHVMIVAGLFGYLLALK